MTTWWNDDRKRQTQKSKGEADEERRMITSSGINILGQPLAKHYEHQLAAFDKGCDKEDFALLMEAGTAKSRIILDMAAHQYKRGAIDTLVVVAPNGVHRNWMDQVTEHLPFEIPRVAAYFQAGASKTHQKWWQHATQAQGVLRILTFNVETLSLESGLKQTLQSVGKRSCLIAVDESQRIKSPSSKRTRNAYKMANIAKFRRILTGTPVSQGLHDLYSQFRFLNWQIIGCRTFAEFKARYCIMGGYEGREILGYRNVEELRRRIAPYVFEANKRDCLDLPAEMWLTREVELSSEQRRLYKEMKDRFVIDLKERRIEAPQAGVRMIRLRQILSGYIPNDDLGETWTNLPNPRLEVCADLVEEAARGKVIIWCHFKADVLNVCAKLKERGIGAVPYYGGINPTQRAANLEQWRKNDKVVGLVATPATGGVGFTLNEADTDITYSHDYNYEEWEQKASRNYRAGQTKPVTHYDLVARGTADVRMLGRVKAKGSVADLIRGMNREALIEMLEAA